MTLFPHVLINYITYKKLHKTTRAIHFLAIVKQYGKIFNMLNTDGKLIRYTGSQQYIQLATAIGMAKLTVPNIRDNIENQSKHEMPSNLLPCHMLNAENTSQSIGLLERTMILAFYVHNSSLHRMTMLPNKHFHVRMCILCSLK